MKKVVNGDMIVSKGDALYCFKLAKNSYNTYALKNARISFASRMAGELSTDMLEYINSKYNKRFHSIREYENSSMTDDFFDILHEYTGALCGIEIENDLVIAVKLIRESLTSCLGTIASESDMRAIERYDRNYGYDKTPSIWMEIIEDIVNKYASADLDITYVNKELAKYNAKDFEENSYYKELLSLING